MNKNTRQCAKKRSLGLPITPKVYVNKRGTQNGNEHTTDRKKQKMDEPVTEASQQPQENDEIVCLKEIKHQTTASTSTLTNQSSVNLPKVKNPAQSRNSNVDAVHKETTQTSSQAEASTSTFKCTIAGCTSTFPSLQLLQQHWQTYNHQIQIQRSPDGWYACPKPNCKRKCNSVGALKGHLFTFHKETSSFADKFPQKSTNATFLQSTLPSSKFPPVNQLPFQYNPAILLQQASGIDYEQWRSLDLEQQRLNQLVAAKKKNSQNEDQDSVLHQKELDQIALKLLCGNQK